MDATSALGLGGDDGAVLHAVWKDFDQDGDLDLLQVNDFGAFLGNSHLFENLGDWRFEDRMADAGIGLLEYPMGAAVRDLDGDGLLDLWISDIDRTSVMRGVAPFAYADAGASWAPGLEGGPGETSWSVVDLDVDGDGWTDIYQAFGPLSPFEAGEPPAPPQPDRVLVQEHTSSGPRYSPLGGMPARLQTSNSRGAAVADFDRNGVLDLVVTQVEGPPTVLLGRDAGAARLTVAIRDTRSENTYGIGAQVTVEAGGRAQRDTLVAGGRGSFSSSEPLLAFGLGDVEEIEHLTVRWPDGEEDEFGPLCADCRVTIRR